MTHDGGAGAERELLEDVLRRSKWDSTFRERLLHSPKQVLEDEYGLKLPDGFVLRFVEKDEGIDAVVVLPDLESEDELSEEELDSVAGGTKASHWGSGGDDG